MAKTGRNSSNKRIVLKPGSGGKPATIRNEKTGEVLVLHGYGGSEGKFEVRKGIDLTKPIYAQVLKLEAGSRRRSSKRRTRKKA